MTEHPSLEESKPAEPKKSPSAEKTESFSEQLKKLREQIQPLDLSPITNRLDNIEAEVKVLRSEREEVNKAQLEVLRLFALALKKRTDET